MSMAQPFDIEKLKDGVIKDLSHLKIEHAITNLVANFPAAAKEAASLDELLEKTDKSIKGLSKLVEDFISNKLKAVSKNNLSAQEKEELRRELKTRAFQQPTIGNLMFAIIGSRLSSVGNAKEYTPVVDLLYKNSVSISLNINALLDFHSQALNSNTILTRLLGSNPIYVEGPNIKLAQHESETSFLARWDNELLKFKSLLERQVIKISMSPTFFEENLGVYAESVLKIHNMADLISDKVIFFLQIQKMGATNEAMYDEILKKINPYYEKWLLEHSVEEMDEDDSSGESTSFKI